MMSKNERRGGTVAGAGLLLVVLLNQTFSWADDGFKQPQKKSVLNYVGQPLDCKHAVGAVALSPDGRLLAIGFARLVGVHAMQIWDTQTRKKIVDLKGHRASVSSLTFSPNGKLLVSTGYDNMLGLWDVDDWPERFTLGDSEAGYPTSVAFSTSGRWLCAVFEHATGMFNMKRLIPGGSLYTRVNGQAETSVVLSTSDESIFILVGDKITHVWNSRKKRDILTFETNQNGITGAALIEDGGTLVTSGRDDTVRFWNLKTGKENQKIVIKTGTASLAYAPSKELLAIGDRKGTIHLYDAKSGLPLRRLKGLEGFVQSIAFSKDATMLVAGATGNNFRERLPHPELPKPSTVRIWSLQKRPIQPSSK